LSAGLASPSDTSTHTYNRDRANSVKRKALDNLALASAKAIKLSNTLPSLVSQLSDHKVLVDKIGVEVSDEKFTDSTDPAIVSILQKFSLAMSAQHSIVSNVVSELEGVKMILSDVQTAVLSQAPPLDPTVFPSLSQSNNPPKKSAGQSGISGISALDSRRPLKQAPLGSNVPWNNVESRKNRKTRSKVAVSQSEFESESESAPPPLKSDPFSAAVKDAEKSILIHNLNLGQAPTLNPATISSKITAALLLCVAQVDPLATGQVTACVKDTIDDIIGLVKGMTLFGSGTRPNRNPLKPEDNGKFYTVPVKLTFASKQIAIRVTEVLKGKYKLPITTPYHKSLRACFTHMQKEVRTLNPSHQVRVNLDTKNRVLKASVRLGEKGPWELLNNSFPLPSEALDPKFQDIKSMSLPALSASPTKPPHPRRSSSNSMECGEDGSEKGSPPSSLSKIKPKQPAPVKDIPASNLKKSNGTTNRFSALARTPPHKPKGNDGAAG